MVRTLLVAGGIGVAAYLGYKWWTGRQIADAATTAPTTTAGSAASSMTSSAARSTIFGGGIVQKLLLAVPVRQLPRPGIAPTAPATLGALVSPTAAGTRGYVFASVLGPQPVAPSPNGDIVTEVGILTAPNSMPRGDQPPPGAPPPPFVSMRGILQ